MELGIIEGLRLGKVVVVVVYIGGRGGTGYWIKEGRSCNGEGCSGGGGIWF